MTSTAQLGDLGDLPAPEHDAVRLVYLEGRSFDDAARALATDRAGVGRVLARAFGRIAAEVLAVESAVGAGVPAVEV